MRAIRFFLPRISYVLLGAIFLGIAASGPRILNFDGDLPRHLLVGNLILHTGQVPTTDTFSYRTAGQPSIPHEWLAQVLFSISYNFLNLSGVVLLTALIVTATAFVIFRDTNRRSNRLFTTLFFTILAISAAAIHILPRPHLFTFVLLAFWMYVLENMSTGESRAWWILPIIMLFWVNLHGMFVLGIMTWLIILVGVLLDHPFAAWKEIAPIRTLLLGGLLSLPVTFLSPSGPKIWGTVVSLASNSYITSLIPEYQSANFHEPGTWPFILMLIITILMLGRAQEKPPWRHSLLLGAFAALAVYSSRMIPIFAIVAAPIEAGLFSRWLQSQEWASKFLSFEDRITQVEVSANGIIWLAGLIAAITLLFASGIRLDPQQKGNAFDPAFFPVQAVEWLKSHPQEGRVFNDFNWGGYLLFELAPGQQVFMDGHTHIYGEELTREYERVISAAEGWDAIMQKYGVSWAIIPSGSILAEKLTQAGWQELYRDTTAVILKK